METKSTDCLASSGVSTAKNPLHGVNGGLFLPPCGPCGNAWHRSTQPLVVTTNTDVSVQRLLFQNLLLLGFDVDVKGGEYRVQFHEDMFKKANNKAMEVVLYFLFSKLSPDETLQEFRDVWPVIDRNQSRDFKKLAYTRLIQLQNDGKVPRGTVRKSYLHTASGGRFLKMMWLVSTHVLENALLQLDSTPYPMMHIPSTTDPNLLSFLIPTAKAHIVSQARKFLSHTRVAVNAQRQWKQFADELTTQYFHVGKQITSMNEQQKQFDDCTSSSLFSQVAQAERKKKLQTVTEAYKVMNTIFDRSTSARRLIEELVSESARQPRLTLQHKIQNPTAARPANTASENVNTLNNNTTESKGTVHVDDMVSRWNESLQQLHDTLSNQLLPVSSCSDSKSSLSALSSNSESNTTKTAESATVFDTPYGRIRNAVKQHDQYVANVRTLASRALSCLSQVRASISELGQLTLSHNRTELKHLTMQTPAKTRTVPLGLVPPTPQMQIRHSWTTITDNIRRTPHKRKTFLSPCTPVPQRVHQRELDRIAMSVRRAVGHTHTHPQMYTHNTAIQPKAHTGASQRDNTGSSEEHKHTQVDDPKRKLEFSPKSNNNDKASGTNTNPNSPHTPTLEMKIMEAFSVSGQQPQHDNEMNTLSDSPIFAHMPTLMESDLENVQTPS